MLALNEVDISMTPTLFEEFAALGLRHQSFFGHVREGQYGNALLGSRCHWNAVTTHTLTAAPSFLNGTVANTASRAACSAPRSPRSAFASR